MVGFEFDSIEAAFGSSGYSFGFGVVDFAPYGGREDIRFFHFPALSCLIFLNTF